jgi:ankyrin repeat protein
MSQGLTVSTASMDPRERVRQAARQGDMTLLASAINTWPIPCLTARDEDGNTPLHISASVGKADVVHVLLDRGAHPLARNATGATPLHLATAVNATSIVKTLMEYGGDPLLKSDQGNCLTIACRMGHSTLVDVFLKSQAWSWDSLWDAMLEALQCLHLETANKFEKYGLDIHAKSSSGVGFLHATSNDNKYLETTRYLLGKGVDINSTDARGFTPLHIAAFNAGPETVAELLAAGANPNARDRINATPVFPAIQKCDTASLKHLLVAGASAKDVIQIGQKRRPLLHIVSQEGTSVTEMAKLLVSYGADISKCDETGAHAAKWAAKAGHMELLRYFHESGSDILGGDDTMQTPLLSACLNGRLDCVAFLISIGADFNSTTKEGHTVLGAAIQENHPEVIKFLLDKGASDLDALGDAFRRRNAEAVQLLLPHHLRIFGDRHGQLKDYAEEAISENNYSLARELVEGLEDIQVLTESTQNSLLLMAATHGNIDLARRLINANTSRNYRQKISLMTPIHVSAELGHVGLINLLAEAGFLTLSETQFGQSALHIAAKNGNVAVIEKLGGIVSSKVKDINGYCPVHWAAIEGHSVCAKALIDLGSYVDPLDNNQRTPLLWAVENGYVDCVKILMDSGSNSRAIDLRRRTCLHLACMYDRLEVLQLLLPRLVDLVDFRDSLGFTALQYAKSEQVTSLLRQNGAGILGNETLGISGLEVSAMRGNVWLVEELLSLSPNLKQSESVIIKLFMASREEPDRKVFDYLVGLRPALERLEKPHLTNLLAECIMESDEHRILAVLTAIFSIGRKPPEGVAERLLVIACKRGFQESVRLLAELPSILDVDVQGLSPLLIACQHGHLEVVKTLLESGANPSVVDPNTHQSAIEIAISGKKEQIVETLKEYTRFLSSKHNPLLEIGTQP